MSNINQKQSQLRAQKLNIGALQALEKKLVKMDKDRKKALQAVDQEIVDSRRFLEYVQACSGNSITREEAFPTLASDFHLHRVSIVDSTAARSKPTQSDVIKLEVQLQKALAENRFKDRSKIFFQKWEEVFKIDLDPDNFLIDDDK